MAETIGVETLLDRIGEVPVVDVRTPAEYDQAHVPGAINLPLFTNEQRAEIGTLYKNEGRDVAMLRGLDLVGPSMRSIVEEAHEIPGDEWIVYCWRGGMRSEAMAWLLSFFGWSIATVSGGYRSYRRRILASIDEPLDVRVLGGKTGSGKTRVLDELMRRGEQVIDLEGLAHHRGSAFGALGEEPQPSQEQFENDLGFEIARVDRSRPLWVEDESRNIGRCIIPDGLWSRMRSARVVFLDVPIESRIGLLVDSYGAFSVAELRDSVERIQRRLGGLRARHAIDHLENGRLSETALILLDYYDRAYLHGLSYRDPSTILTLRCESTDFEANADCVLTAIEAPSQVE